MRLVHTYRFNRRMNLVSYEAVPIVGRSFPLISLPRDCVERIAGAIDTSTGNVR